MTRAYQMCRRVHSAALVARVFGWLLSGAHYIEPRRLGVPFRRRYLLRLLNQLLLASFRFHFYCMNAMYKPPLEFVYASARAMNYWRGSVCFRWDEVGRPSLKFTPKWKAAIITCISPRSRADVASARFTPLHRSFTKGTTILRCH